MKNKKTPFEKRQQKEANYTLAVKFYLENVSLITNIIEKLKEIRNNFPHP